MFYLIKLKADTSKFVVLPASSVGIMIEKVEGEEIQYTVTMEKGVLYKPADIDGLKMLNAEEVKLSI